MALTATGLSADIWSAFTDAFPTMATARRENLAAGVSLHRPMEEVVKAWSSAVVSNIVGLPCSGSAEVTCVLGAYTFPAPLPAIFPATSTFRAEFVAKLASDLGWVGAAGNLTNLSLINSFSDYISNNAQLSSLVSVNSGAAVPVEITVSEVALTASIINSAVDNLLLTGYFYHKDIPAMGLSSELLNMISSWSSLVPMLLKKSLTNVVVLPVGTNAAAAISIAGVLI